MLGEAEGELELSRFVASGAPFFLCDRANRSPHALQRLFFPPFFPSEGPRRHSGEFVVPQASQAFAPSFFGLAFGGGRAREVERVSFDGPATDDECERGCGGCEREESG